MKIQQNDRHTRILFTLVLTACLGVSCKTMDCGCPMAYEQTELKSISSKPGNFLTTNNSQALQESTSNSLAPVTTQ